MEKLVYLLWNETGRAGPALRDRLLTGVVPAWRAGGATRLTVDVADGAGEAGEVRLPLPPPPDDPAPVALVSGWLDTLDDRGPLEDALRGLGLRYGGYLVTESVCTDYGDNRWGRRRDWADGVRSPGFVMLTCMERPARLTHDEWLDLWQGRQSPVSTRMQPRARYVRNAVVRVLTPDAPPLSGIVEEAWPDARHVNDPMLFYLAEGSEERLAANMAEMLDSVTAFLDLDRLRCAAMSEYLLTG